LALLLVLTLGTLLYVEQKAMARQAKGGTALGQHVRETLSGGKAWAASIAMALPVIFGFMVPCVLLVTHSWRRFNEAFASENLRAFGASLSVAGLACIFTLVAALALVYVKRHHDTPLLAFTTRLASLGYALPGAVLGLGLLVPFGQFDQAFNAFTNTVFGWKPGLILSGGLFAVVFAYVVRFLIIALSNLGDGMDKIPTTLDYVSRTLGRSPFRAFLEIQLPLLKPAMIAGGLLVMVDAMKELPATLILRPFDFDTLATRVFSLASLGQYESAAIPALAIVVAGLLPVIVLSKSFKSAEDR
jgi:iron(III) transport system permease protein